MGLKIDETVTQFMVSYHSDITDTVSSITDQNDIKEHIDDMTVCLALRKTKGNNTAQY